MYLPIQILPPTLAERITEQLPLILGAVILYAIGFVGVTYLSRRQYTDSITDYAVASRSLGWAVTTMTIYASVLSGIGLVGFPGAVYQLGVVFFATLMLGFSMSALLIWYFGRRIWILGREHDFTTPGDLLGGYYGSDSVRMLTVVGSLVYNVSFIVGQLLAGGILLNVLTGGAISPQIGMTLIAGIVVIHVASSGIRGIAHLDTMNGVIILLSLIVFGVLIVADAGNLANVFAGLGDFEATHTTVPGPVPIFTPTRIFGVSIGLLVGVAVLAPHSWMRFYAAKSGQSLAKVGAAMLGLMILSHLIGTYLIGTYGRVQFPDVVNPDFASSLLAFQVMPFALAALFLIAVLAAIISTTDSYMHALSTTVMRDFVRNILRDSTTNDQELSGNRTLTLVIAIVAILLAMNYPGLITPLAVLAGGITLQLLPPLFGAVSWPRASTEAAIISPTIGIILTFGWELGFIPNPVPPTLLPGLAAAFFVNATLFVVISYLTSPQPLERIEAFHGVIHDELNS